MNADGSDHFVFDQEGVGEELSMLICRCLGWHWRRFRQTRTAMRHRRQSSNRFCSQLLGYWSQCCWLRGTAATCFGLVLSLDMAKATPLLPTYFFAFGQFVTGDARLEASTNGCALRREYSKAGVSSSVPAVEFLLM